MLSVRSGYLFIIVHEFSLFWMRPPLRDRGDQRPPSRNDQKVVREWLFD